MGYSCPIPFLPFLYRPLDLNPIFATLHLTMDMDLRGAYEALRAEIFRELELAAKEQNFKRVQHISQKLRELETWWLGDSVSDEDSTATESRTPNIKGKAPREAWVLAREQEGIPLRKIKGAVYQAPIGKVGIAFATEWPRRPNHFLLGLQDGVSLAAAALLCQRKNGIFDIVLPPEFMKNHWSKLSRSSGQVKINIRWLESGAVGLLIPKHAWADVTGYVSNYGGLIGGSAIQER